MCARVAESLSGPVMRTIVELREEGVVCPSLFDVYMNGVVRKVKTFLPYIVQYDIGKLIN